MRQRVERLAEPEFVQQPQRRRVHGVAAEVAQEVRVLLQHGHVDAGAGEQQAEEHAGRTAACDGAGGPVRGIGLAWCPLFFNGG